MARRSPPRKVTYFEPVMPQLARNTIIESSFEVGQRFRCTMRVDCGQLDPSAVIRPEPGEWHPRMPERLEEEELTDWRAGRNAIYQLAALTIGARLAVVSARVKGRYAVFDPDRFIEECRAAVSADGTHRSVREIIARVVSNPSDVIAGLGEPVRAGVQRLYNGPDLTILNVVWGARMTVMPHNHLMWAVIGVYTGREDNIFWRRLPDAPDGTIEAAGAKSLGERDVEPLGRDIIHSVTNPLSRLTGGIHVYGGDFSAAHAVRSEWDPETLREGRYDLERNIRLFEEANRAGASL